MAHVMPLACCPNTLVFYEARNSGYQIPFLHQICSAVHARWFDRDLSVSGRVLVRNADGGIDQRLVKVDRPVLRVPTLCIHLQTNDERVRAVRIDLLPVRIPCFLHSHHPLTGGF